MYKISKLVAIALGILGVILCGGILFAGVDPWADLLFGVSCVLLFIAVISVAIFGFINIVSSPEKIKKTLIYTGVFVLIIILPYFLFSASFVYFDPKIPVEKQPTAIVQRLVSTGIIAFYIFGGIAVLLMVVSGVKNALTK